MAPDSEGRNFFTGEKKFLHGIGTRFVSEAFCPRSGALVGQAGRNEHIVPVV